MLEDSGSAGIEDEKERRNALGVNRKEFGGVGWSGVVVEKTHHLFCLHLGEE